MHFPHLFGNDKSTEFIKQLPQFTRKRFIVTALIGLAIFIILLTLIRSLIFNLWLGSSTLSNTGKYLLSSYIFYPLAVIVSLICFYPQKTVIIKQLTSLRFTEVLKHSIILMTLNFCLAYFFNLFKLWTGSPEVASKIVSSYEGLAKFYSLSGIFVFQWILVGLSEEIIFRGGVYRGFRSVVSKNLAFILAAGIFVVMHPLNLYTSVPIFILAVINAAYFEYKNNLTTLIIVHIFQDMYIAGTALYLAAFTIHWLR